MRVAIVHDWLTVYAGAERVLEQMLAVFPDADLFALIEFVPAAERGFLGGRTVHTSWLQRAPGVRRHYRRYLPLMPQAVQGLDVSAYDIVLSSSHAVAKGVRTRPDQLHLCYCHSPMRYAWDLRPQYLRETHLDRGLRGFLAHKLLDWLQEWDVQTALGVDAFIANSEHIRRRIKAAYGRDATVIRPPVDVDFFHTAAAARQGYYVTASRLVPYKRVDLIAEAFASLPDRHLVVVGDGPEVGKIRAKAGSNVCLLGHLAAPELRRHLQSARAFLFAAEEDFGIAPLEALACGTPVIGYGAGGLPETVRDLDEPEPTGVLFTEQSAASLVDAIKRFEGSPGRVTSAACRRSVEALAPARFRDELGAYVRGQWAGRHAVP